MVTTKEECLPRASEEGFLTREERLGVGAVDSRKETEPIAATETPELVTLSVEEHLEGLWKFLGLSLED